MFVPSLIAMRSFSRRLTTGGPNFSAALPLSILFVSNLDQFIEHSDYEKSLVFLFPFKQIPV
jgi:hypothetical protein